MDADAVLAGIAANIERVGWSLMGVGAGDGQPPFCYTIGLSPAHPELMIRGLGFENMAAILNTLGEMAQTAPLPLDEPLFDVLAPHEGVRYPVLITRQTIIDFDAWGIANSWHAENGRYMYERLAVLWPDNEGRLPTDPTCDRLVADLQRPW
jgi:hypothetical protein